MTSRGRLPLGRRQLEFSSTLKKRSTLCGRTDCYTNCNAWVFRGISSNGSSLSTSFPMENGSPQGSVISPVLSIILLNDIHEPMNGIKLRCCQDHVIRNADDSAIWRSSYKQEVNERELQRYLDRVKKYFDDWGFKVSTSKTVRFKKRQRPEGKPP